MYRKLYKFLLRTKIKNLFVIGIVLPVFFSLMIVFLHLLFPDVLSFPEKDDIMQKIKQNPFLVVGPILIGPYLETLLQYVPVKISNHFFQKKFKYANLLAIIISAIIFGYLHEGFAFMIFVPLSFAGFVWALLCLVFMKRNYYPYLTIVVIHAGYNALLLALDYLSY